jgi:hypothetical protein
MKVETPLLLAAFVAISGCATKLPASVDNGSVYAAITDSGFSDNAVRDQVFAVIAIDGTEIISAFNDENRKRMMAINHNPPFTGRRVPVRELTLKLRGAASGAPIVSMMSAVAGSARPIEGTIKFTPREGAFYVVKGELSSTGSCVWLEEERKPGPVSQKVCTS